MAKPPRCKVCNSEHWLNEPHTFTGPSRPLTPVGEAEAPITDAEIAEYEACLAIVKAAFGRFVIDAAGALARIRDKRLYRRDFETFEAFCQETFGHPRSWANRKIAAHVKAALPAPAAADFGSNDPNQIQASKTTQISVNDRSVSPEAPEAEEMTRNIETDATPRAAGVGQSSVSAAAPPPPELPDDMSMCPRCGHIHTFAGHGPACPVCDCDENPGPGPASHVFRPIIYAGEAPLEDAHLCAICRDHRNNHSLFPVTLPNEPRQMPAEAPESRVAALKRRSRYCTTHTLPCDCISARVVEALLLALGVTRGFSGPMMIEALGPKVEEALRAMSVPEEEWMP